MTTIDLTARSRHGQLGDVALPRHKIDARVAQLGADVTSAYLGASAVFVGALKPTAPFLADLVRATTIPHTVASVEVAAYSEGQHGRVRLVDELELDVSGRHVVVVADIVDTGLTLHFVCRTLEKRNPASMSVVTLLDRPRRRVVDIPLRWIGFSVPDELFAGYGLGQDERWRKLPDLHIVRGTTLSSSAREAA
jgi:hypoxanthine phosphoribosyltransferase